MKTTAANVIDLEAYRQKKRGTERSMETPAAFMYVPVWICWVPIWTPLVP